MNNIIQNQTFILNNPSFNLNNIVLQEFVDRRSNNFK